MDIEAGKALYLYAIKDKKYSKTDVKKRSSWLGIRYSKDHTNDTHQEISQLPATLIGGKAYTKSGGDTLLQGTVFNTLKPADIQVGVGKYADKDAKLILEPITSQVQKTHLQEKESIVWQKQVNSGSVVTTADMPKFNQTPTITSENGIEITVPVEVTVKDNQKAKTRILSQNDLGKIAVELSKKPGYEYLADLDKRNDINWKQVELIQKNWHYEQEGLTAAAAALIAIAVTIAVGGMDGGGIATSLLSFTEGTVSAAAANAGLASLASQASVILINNKGDISQTLDYLATSDVARKMATAALTAGISAELATKFNLKADPTSFADKLKNGVIEGLTETFVDVAINKVDLEDALTNQLRGALVDALAAQAFTDIVKPINVNADDFASNLAHKLVAAGVGCVSSEAKGQDCNAGAIGAAVGEVVAEMVTSDDNRFLLELGLLDQSEINKINNIAQLSAGAIALLANTDVDVAVNSANIAVKNNHNLKSANDVEISDEAGHLIANIIGGVLPVGTVKEVTIALQNGASYGEIAQIIGAEGIFFLTKSKKLGELGNAIRKYNKTCFTAGTLIETSNGLKPIEDIQIGDMVWSRHEETLEFGYRPVTETASFEEKQIYEVVVTNKEGKRETYQTTEEHPFWVHEFGWLPASSLMAGMMLVNRNNQTLTVVSQTKLDETDTVYNFTVDEFHTYHIGELGVWVHNNNCAVSNMSDFFTNREFGKLASSVSTKQSRQVQNQSVYTANRKIGDYIRKGDQYYLDNRHKDHLEVFDKNNNFRYVLNLDGTLNEAKTKAAKGRTIK